jgi:hypothetical protein
MNMLLSKIRVNRFSSADTIFSRSPSENIIVVGADNRSGFNGMDGLITEGGGEKLMVPILGTRDLELRDLSRQR